MNPDPIQPPVRVLIRTRPVQLEKIKRSLFEADSILIEKLCVELSIKDTTKIAHLITKIADDKKQKERVDIIFDYGVSTDEGQPKVRAYHINVNGSNLVIKDYFHPAIKPTVNMVVSLYRSQNSQEGLAFPSRTDVRRRRLTVQPALST
jgi:hypothetical protein